MKISIVTATFNNKNGLVRAIESVRTQTYKNVEHIIVDGFSTDGTAETFNKLQITNYQLQFVSEHDSGIYDAINKGIKLATGDVIGLLHSDDFYKDEFVLEKYAEAFQDKRIKKKEQSILSSREEARDLKDFSVTALLRNDNTLPTANPLQPTIDAVYSDLVYVRSEKRDVISNDTIFDDNNHSIIRYWKTQDQDFTTEVQRHRAIEKGWMPPHPTLFVKKSVFEKYGLYRTDMKIAADYEMILRIFYKYKITSHYLPITTYCMSIGGASNKSIKNILLKSKEDFRAMKIQALPHPIKTLIFKNLSKISQFIKR